MAATSEKIIADLEALGDKAKIIGYVTALLSLDAITWPPGVGTNSMVKAPGINSPGRPARTRGGMSKVAQAIVATFTPEGLSKRALVIATNLTPLQVEKALPTMLKNGIATLKNGRYFAGPALAKATPAAPAATKVKAKTTKTKASKSDHGAMVREALALSLGPLTRAMLQQAIVARGVRANHAGLAISREWKAKRIAGEELGPYVLTPAEQRSAA